MIIYKVVNIVNNKCYIGQTIQSLESRKRKHLKVTADGSTAHFHRALRKYDAENFKWTILATVASLFETNFLEPLYIERHDSFHNGYNMTTGGDNCKLSEETKRKIGLGNKGKTVSAEARANISRGLTGKPLSKEHRKLLSKIHKGKPKTETHKQHIAEALKGKAHPQQKVVCPHCKKEGGKANMKRYHFENCKELI
jgi:group I intron endonuclease